MSYGRLLVDERWRIVGYLSSRQAKENRLQIRLLVSCNNYQIVKGNFGVERTRHYFLLYIRSIFQFLKTLLQKKHKNSINLFIKIHRKIQTTNKKKTKKI